MDMPGRSLRTARTAAGLSVRGLAVRAGVSPTTVARIESGESDPTVGTLSKLLRATDHDWVSTVRRTARGARPSQVALEHLSKAWSPQPWGPEPDWPRFRAVLDELRQHEDWVPSAIHRRPRASGSLYIDNLLAGLAEILAAEVGIQPPGWATQVPPLEHPVVPPGTPRMIARWRATTPAELSARRLIVDSASLWHATLPEVKRTRHSA